MLSTTQAQIGAAGLGIMTGAFLIPLFWGSIATARACKLLHCSQLSYPLETASGRIVRCPPHTRFTKRKPIKQRGQEMRLSTPHR